MDKHVMLSILGVQTDVRGQDQTVEIITEGTFSHHDGIYSLEYQESDLSDMVGTTTSIIVEDGRVSLLRRGSNTAHFVFEHGTKCINSYTTPFGVMEMGVYPLHIGYALSDNGGELDLQYQLDICGNFSSINQLSVSIREDVTYELLHRTS